MKKIFFLLISKEDVTKKIITFKVKLKIKKMSSIPNFKKPLKSYYPFLLSQVFRHMVWNCSKSYNIPTYHIQLILTYSTFQNTLEFSFDYTIMFYSWGWKQLGHLSYLLKSFSFSKECESKFWCWNIHKISGHRAIRKIYIHMIVIHPYACEQHIQYHN